MVADQLTKTWALRVLDDGAIDLLGSLRLRLVFNTGSAFSIGEGLGPTLGVLAIVVVAVLIRTGRAVEGAAAVGALGLVVGGAVGNLTDRAVRRGDGFLGGAVVDFIDLQWWPVFNLADVAIVVGAVALALTLGRETGTASGGAP